MMSGIYKNVASTKFPVFEKYRQVSIIRRTLAGN